MHSTMLLIEVRRVGSIPDYRSTPIVAALMSMEASLACFSLWGILAIVNICRHYLIEIRVLLLFIAQT
jgi:hypothetical protein